MALRAKPGGYGGVVEVEARGGTASTSGAAPLGTTRNRTELFLKYRRQARGSSRPLTPPGAGAADRWVAGGALGARGARCSVARLRLARRRCGTAHAASKCAYWHGATGQAIHRIPCLPSSQAIHVLCCRSSLETARLMASALGGGLDSAEAGVAGVMAAMPPQYVEFKEQVRRAQPADSTL